MSSRSADSNAHQETKNTVSVRKSSLIHYYKEKNVKYLTVQNQNTEKVSLKLVYWWDRYFARADKNVKLKIQAVTPSNLIDAPACRNTEQVKNK